MDGPVFDAMLKNALEEALRQDAEETPAPPPPSRRQRQRMRRLLAEPWRAGLPEEEAGRRGRNPARWLAVVVIAALLTGAAAAGFALGGGERFRRMFEENTWAADYYKSAADTEQLLNLGAGMDTVLVESGGLRFEMLDAVFDGQRAMVELRMTLLDPDLLERFRERGDTLYFGDSEVLLESGRDVRSWGYSSSSWKAESAEESLEEGQYSLIFSINDEALNGGGQCGIRLRNLVYFGEEGDPETLITGEWTLAIILRPTEIFHLEPNAVCRANGAEWILDGVTLSPLALGLTFHRTDAGEQHFRWTPCKDLSIRLKNGEVLDVKGTTGVGSSDTHMDMQVEFLMPLDLEQVESLHVCGVDIPLRE